LVVKVCGRHCRTLLKQAAFTALIPASSTCIWLVKNTAQQFLYICSIGVGDGGRGMSPKILKKKISGKYRAKFVHFVNFGGKYHVKFRHFVNFSCTYFPAKMFCPQKLTELLWYVCTLYNREFKRSTVCQNIRIVCLIRQLHFLLTKVNNAT